MDNKKTVVEQEYGIIPSAVVDVTDVPNPNNPDTSVHDHVVVKWAGGEIWLDMSDLSDHFCIDIRQFNPDGEMKGQGYFTIVNGWRGKQAEELCGTDGKPVTGRKWNGGYVATLLTDHHGKEAAAIKPSQGNG